jgi:putative SOS response-associated peptidase YedK
MCGRYSLKETPKKLAEHFHLAEEGEFSPSYNIAPSLAICTITADKDGARRLSKKRWGLIPAWAKDATIGNKLSNARGETVAEKPSFRSAFKARRCIIPASGFYEWQAANGVKQPWYMTLRSGEPMAFAGIWETWQQDGAEPIETCCIITTAGNELMQPIHDRMPVILNPDSWEQWLSTTERNVDSLLPLIRPYDSAHMQAWAVTRELNKVGARNDDGLTSPLPPTSLFD